MTGRIWKWVESQSRTTESGENLRHHGPDLPRANHADCLAVHIEPDQAVESEIAFPDAIICAMHLSVEREHKGAGVLCDRVRRVRWNTYHCNVMFRCGWQIDIVVTCATQRDQPHAQLTQFRNHRSIDL